MHCPKRSILRRLVAGWLLAGAACAASAAAPVSKLPAAEDIVAHNVEARGGAAKLRAIAVLHRSGRLVLPGMSLELGLSEWKTRAGAYRQDAALQGMTAVQAYDGHDAWQVQPFGGRKDPSRMSEDEARAISLNADIEFPFVDAHTKGHSVEYLGLEDVDGTPAHALRVHLKGGDEATYWIDPDTWMVIRVLEQHRIRGAEDTTETDFGEYQQVAGVWVPMTEESGPKGSDPSQRQKFVYDKLDVNGPAPASLFAFPEATAKTAAGAHP